MFARIDPRRNNPEYPPPPARSHTVHPAPATTLRFVALFSNETALLKCRVLRRGFRHCAVAVETPQGWTLINPRRAGLIRQSLQHNNPRDIIDALAATFPRAVVGTRRHEHHPHSTPNPTTCVGVCKRFIGLDAPRVRTPHQLFHALTGESRSHGETDAPHTGTRPASATAQA